MAKIKIHSIKCRKPQETGFFANGDEIWIRLEGSGHVVYSPAGGSSTWQMVAARTRDVNMEVEFETTAELEIWDDDSAITAGGPVEQRDNELLATKIFFALEDILEQVEYLDPGDRAEGALYKVRYSITM